MSPLYPSKSDNHSIIFSHPIFSVILISYRHDNNFEDAFKSIVNQDLSPLMFEVIVVCKSTGIPVSYLNNHDFPFRVKLVIDDDSKMGAKYEKAIREASGCWLSFLDDDDMWHYKKLSILEYVISLKEGISYVHNSKVVINSSTDFVDTREILANTYVRLPVQPLELSTIRNFTFCEHNGSSITIRKSIVKAFLEQVKELEGAIDTLLFLLAMDRGNLILCLSTQLTYFRERPHSNFNSTALEKDLNRQLHGYLSISKIAFKTKLPGTIIDYMITKNKVKVSILRSTRIQTRIFWNFIMEGIVNRRLADKEFLGMSILTIFSQISGSISKRLYEASQLLK